MANDRISKSAHARGKRHLLLTVGAMFIIMWGIPIIATAIGVWADPFLLWAIMPLAVLWFLYGGLGSFLIACPQCGRSVFMRGFWSVPWPARRCSKCGHDLTVTDQSEQKA